MAGVRQGLCFQLRVDLQLMMPSRPLAPQPRTDNTEGIWIIAEGK
jgi:hypothetical protein